ncbi:MAG: low-specificity L-threonine aldolase, partial [Anaerolineales bacterium]
TLPTPAMWQAIAHAELGDDVYGEDPTVNRLEAMSAERLGKQACLFVPSGTMGNLAAALAHCNRGDEVILGDISHTFLYEAGGMAALGGVQPRTIPNQPDGTLSLEAIEAAIRPDDAHFPITRLIILENTHNRCGGAALSVEYTQQVGELARSRGLKLHLDGARIFNAAVALGVESRELAEPADSVTFCLSKALCAPVGSVLCGDQDFIHRARRARKQLGGGMRQAGVLAAAGIVSLETMIDRLAEDHARARKLAQGLQGVPGIEVENDPPPTNMVYLRFLPEATPDAEGLAGAITEWQIKVHAVEKRRLRLVLHYWVDDRAVEKVIEAFRQIMGGNA